MFVELVTQLIDRKMGKIPNGTNLNDLCAAMGTLIQQRINQLRFFSSFSSPLIIERRFSFSSKIEKDDQQQRSSLVMDSYEEALAKGNLDFTKQ